MECAEPRDTVTGLVSENSAKELIATWQQRAKLVGEKAPIHAMMLSLGRFDTVSRAYGKSRGDGALLEVGRRLSCFAEDEFEHADWCAAHLGEGTFLLIAHDACSRERWQWLAEAVADAIIHPIAQFSSSEIIRLWPRISLMRALPGEAPGLIIDQLSENIRSNRRKVGKRISWVEVADAPRGISAARLEADLLRALDNHEIEIVFQPQISTETGAVIGAEALARWEHKEIGRIGGDQLFAIAERADYTAQLSRHILERAMGEAKAWPEGVRLSLNVTSADLAASSFAKDFLALVKQSGLLPGRITLEITEQILLGDLGEVCRILEVLRASGMKIALDDFGAGFCNFRYLKVLPLDVVKLDRSMLEGIADDERDLGILRAIITMADVLGLEVVAEGIETEAQRAIIAGEGCRVYQGFLGGAARDNSAFLANLTA